VHLLHEERGPVIEILVARTLRHVESSQEMCRIVGLSATLPNYKDVKEFLAVPEHGVFYFDGRYRPVPLTQFYVGVTEKNSQKRRHTMNLVCYEKVIQNVEAGHQVMVFVHSRNDTVKTAEFLRNEAQQKGKANLFSFMGGEEGKSKDKRYNDLAKRLLRSKSPELRSLFPGGFGIHHAGMVRDDRTWVEEAFEGGYIQVLVCTATLAWGVNLPAHSVIIKGTQVYNAKRGGFVDVGMLDVMQIFGRAGRPQYDTTGEGVIITSQDKLAHYLRLLTHALPIESQFIEQLPDHLNAEIILGTVTNLKEAIAWLAFTYLYIRMLRNPAAYGISYDELNRDHLLVDKRRSLIVAAAKLLLQSRMIKYDFQSGNFFSTDVGRVASYYYIHYESIEKYNYAMPKEGIMSDEDIMHLLACSKEFDQIKIRDEEQGELDKLAKMYCPIKVNGASDSAVGKANVLLQTYISQGYIQSSTLISDSYYIQQSAGRITRALFEMVLKRGKVYLAERFLMFCKMIDKRVWHFQTPLRQFKHINYNLIQRVEAANLTVDRILDTSAGELASVLNRISTDANQVIKACNQIPYLELSASVKICNV
jgi:activating signal cointegrator complex subunit 3